MKDTDRQAAVGMPCLTKRQRVFVREYLRTNNIRQAARRAGFKNPESYGYEVRNKPRVKAAIAQARSDVRWLLAQDAAEALSMLVELMNSSQTDSVRLRAALEILDRADGDRRGAGREDERGNAGGARLLDYADQAAVAARVEELRRRLLGEAAGDGEDG